MKGGESGEDGAPSAEGSSRRQSSREGAAGDRGRAASEGALRGQCRRECDRVASFHAG